MKINEKHFHYVCTLEEAKDLINQNNQFWVSNCGCREPRGGCEQSRMDLCLFFKPDMGGTGSGFMKVDRGFAEEILKTAQDNYLVSRPFREEENKTKTQGICFCCDDCCGYFLKTEEKCDKGQYIEKTNKAACIACGLCTDVCYFKARKLENDELVVDRIRCYGCGLCSDICPMGAVEMVLRKKNNSSE